MLIITGWGSKYEYAYAGALALSKYCDRVKALRGISKRFLPEFLDQLANDCEMKYSEILILGVGLDGNPEKLMNALKKLYDRQTKVSWLSIMKPPFDIDSSLLEIHIEESEKNIALAAKKFFAHTLGSELDNLFVPDFKEKPASSKDKPSSGLSMVQEYRHLLDAATYYHRQEQNETAYSEALRHIANNHLPKLWTSSERMLVERFLRLDGREIIGNSPAMQNLRKMIRSCAQTSSEHARVLILGESGTGKEVVATQIHDQSSRKNEEFVTFNCATMAPQLLESRLFGYEKGAFSGADTPKEGLFSVANGGTLFLDEIGELPLEAQGTLLRVLETGRFQKIGGSQEIDVDVRLITATNCNLAEMVKKKKFRQDLFFRLCVLPITMPALREHPEDIGEIANHRWFNLKAHALSEKQIRALQNYDYPGNVRELYNLLERAASLGIEDFDYLLEEQKKIIAGMNGPDLDEPPENLEENEKWHIQRILDKYSGNKSKAAAALDISRNTLNSKMRKYGLVSDNDF